MSDDYSHLLPIVEALLAAGNSLEPDTSTSAPFRPDQSGFYCPLVRPIAFVAVRHLTLRPEVHLVEDDDYIWCEHCWAEIRGGAYRSQTINDS